MVWTAGMQPLLLPPQDMDGQQAKSLGKLNTDEVCQWFTRIGFQKCLPVIRGIERNSSPTWCCTTKTLTYTVLTPAANICQLIQSCSCLRLDWTWLSHFKKCEQKSLSSFLFDWLLDCFVYIVLQRPNFVVLTWPRSARTSFTPSTSAQWRTRSSCCRPFTASCTLPPSSPGGSTLCWVQARRLTRDREAFAPWRLTDVSAESPNPCDVETLAAALATMNKSKSSPHVSCLSRSRRSLKLRCVFSHTSKLHHRLHYLSF